MIHLYVDVDVPRLIACPFSHIERETLEILVQLPLQLNDVICHEAETVVTYYHSLRMFG
jgi:hypothetical protein